MATDLKKSGKAPAPEEPEALDLRSMDITEEKTQELLRLFPEVHTEGGKIDFDRLRLALGETIDTGRERYGMTWPGKADCFRTIQTPSIGTLLPSREESVHFDTTENLIIEGDNLEVLKLLQKSYLGKVKMIYIDPPYNTGNDFIYPDNYSESLQTYLEYTGQVDDEGRKFSTNPETDGRFHSKWLNMMYPRLYLARNLLRDDGVVFISIDDHEVTNLRLICDYIFGEENLVACLIWQKMDSPSRNEVERATTNFHDYVLMYARNNSLLKLRRKAKPEILDAYPLTLDDGRLARRRQLRKNGKNAKREDRPTLWFPLTAPDGSEVWPLHPEEGWEGRWVLSIETWKEREAAGLTQWIQRDYGWVPYYIETPAETPTTPWPTIWTEVDQNRQAAARFTDLMGSTVSFQSPKPPSLIVDMVRMATDEESLVLDFFAGSGSTADALLDLNHSGCGERKFILVQLPEPTGRDDYKTIADITKERVRRVIKRLDDEDAGKLDLDGGTKQDRGFRVFKLAESNLTTWDADAPADERSLGEQLQLHVDHIRPGRSQEDILFEILLKSGYPLTAKVETLELARKKVFSIAEGALLVCLENALTIEVIRAIAEKKPERVVCLDAGFAGNDQLKANAVQIFKTLHRRGDEPAASSDVTVFRTV